MTELSAGRPTAEAHVRFPIFYSLNITDYGLYPGTENEPGLHIDFKKGLTLVIGTNGLGKTTLVTVLYRMLSGGYELSRSTLEATELGGAAIDSSRMKPKSRRLFAERVNDHARDSEAVLDVGIGETRLLITRRLDNLDLVNLHIDRERSALDEEGFQQKILELSGLSKFGDWLLFLRQMVFYFEDRRSLVWDSSAQRHAFRMLFLPAEQSNALYLKERTVLQLDSQVRNDHAALTRLQKRVAQDELKQDGAKDVRAHIRSLTPVQEQELREKAELLEHIDHLDEQRRALRRDLLLAENRTSQLEGELEGIRLRTVYSRFPSQAETAKYLLSLLMSDRRCPVCSSENEALTEVLNQRANEFACILCGTPSQSQPHSNMISVDQERLRKLRRELADQKRRVEALRSDLQGSTTKYNNVSTRLIQLTDDIEERQRTLDTLIASLPAEEEKLREAKNDLVALRTQIEDDRRRLESFSEQLRKATANLDSRVQEKATAIKDAFAKYAEGFLFENVSLKWHTYTHRIGQLQKVESASFDLDMSGTDFQQAQRRHGPEAVSESQREFIDLAFRMALIEVAGAGTGGSLIIDAPESSLDAVFVERAADILCQFGESSAPNRLVIASNLIDGRLLPRLLKQGIPRAERETRLVNLMEIAVPTGAVKAAAEKYQKEWHNILEEAGLV